MLEEAIATLTIEIRRLTEAVLAQNALLVARTHVPVPEATASTAPAPPPRATPLGGEALDERATAKLLGVSVALVRRWRQLDTGPPFRKLGRLVRYHRKELMDWLDAVPRGGESR
jgi:predicted DNA-binding transcriptional regulator AlpA